MLNPSNIVEHTPVTVLVGDDWTTLVANDELRPVSVEVRLAPGKSKATIASDYGALSNGGPFATRTPVDLAGKVVQIRLGEPGSDRMVFEGIVRNQSMRPNGTFDEVGSDVPNGEILHYAEGLESILDRATPSHTVAVATAVVGQPITGKEVTRLFSFNGDGEKLVPNRSYDLLADAQGYTYIFDWSTTATTWTALNIADYLARWASSQSNYHWVVDGETTALDKIVRQLPMSDGKTLRQLLNELIRPQDGLSWRVVRLTATELRIEVLSLSDQAIYDLDGTTVMLPANANTVQLSQQTEYSRDLDPPTITKVGDSAYRYIEVRGEPIRITATLTHLPYEIPFSPFENNWETGDETAFAAATDFERQADTYRDVYARFRLRQDWDGVQTETPNGIYVGGAAAYGATINCLAPTLDPATCDVVFDIAAPGTLIPWAIVFERTWPDANGEEQPAVLSLIDQRQRYDTLVGGAPVQIYPWANPVRTEDSDVPSVGVHVLDKGPELRLRARSNVQIAKPTFAGESKYSPAWHPSTDGFSLKTSWYSHEVLRVRVDNGSGEGTKRVDAPGMHLWIDADYYHKDMVGAPTGPQMMRDDRNTIRRLARMVSTWYGRQRATVDISARVIPSVSRLGYLVSQVYSGGAWTPAGTVVSSETYTWDQRGELTYRVATSFVDLDWTRITRRRALATERDLRGRLRRVESRLSGPSVQSPMGDKPDPGLMVTWIDSTHLRVVAKYNYVDGGGSSEIDQTYSFTITGTPSGSIRFYHRFDIFEDDDVPHPLYWQFQDGALCTVTGDNDATNDLRRNSVLLSEPGNQATLVASVSLARAGEVFSVPPWAPGARYAKQRTFSLTRNSGGFWTFAVPYGESVNLVDGTANTIRAYAINGGWMSNLTTDIADVPENGWSRAIAQVTIDADGLVTKFNYWDGSVHTMTHTNPPA